MDCLTVQVILLTKHPQVDIILIATSSHFCQRLEGTENLAAFAGNGIPLNKICAYCFTRSGRYSSHLATAGSNRQKKKQCTNSKSASQQYRSMHTPNGFEMRSADIVDHCIPKETMAFSPLRWRAAPACLLRLALPGVRRSFGHRPNAAPKEGWRAAMMGLPPCLSSKTSRPLRLSAPFLLTRKVCPRLLHCHYARLECDARDVACLIAHAVQLWNR